MRRALLLVAHRGASAVAPESTQAALDAAARAGANAVELDVQMTRDGRLVIFHDERLERTTNGTGELAAHRYAQLAALDAGAWFHPRFAGERILLVSQVLQRLPQRMRINLELKRTPRRRALLARFMRLLRWTHARQRVLVSSFDARLLEPLAPLRIACALICRQAPEWSLRTAIRLGCVAWHPHVSVLTRRRIQQAHAAGLRVHAWTVDDPSRARRLLRWGVDGLFTNNPARLRGVMR